MVCQSSIQRRTEEWSQVHLARERPRDLDNSRQNACLTDPDDRLQNVWNSGSRTLESLDNDALYNSNGTSA